MLGDELGLIRRRLLLRQRVSKGTGRFGRRLTFGRDKDGWDD